jgi:hypothetical protein
MASTSHHIVHDTAEESEDGECESGISITTTDAEGTEAPKKVKILLLVDNMADWIISFLAQAMYDLLPSPSSSLL